MPPGRLRTRAARQATSPSRVGTSSDTCSQDTPGARKVAQAGGHRTPTADQAFAVALYSKLPEPYMAKAALSMPARAPA